MTITAGKQWRKDEKIASDALMFPGFMFAGGTIKIDHENEIGKLVILL